MHLVVGFLNVMLGHFLATIYGAMPLEFIGRAAVRRCCAAYLAGAGIDEAAITVLQRMGSKGIRLLQADATRKGKGEIAHHVLKMLAPKSRGTQAGDSANQ